MSDYIRKILEAHKTQEEHECCFHLYGGPIWMVIPDGHVVEKCCQCNCTRTVHAEHRDGDHRRPWQTPRRRWTCELRAR